MWNGSVSLSGGNSIQIIDNDVDTGNIVNINRESRFIFVNSGISLLSGKFVSISQNKIFCPKKINPVDRFLVNVGIHVLTDIEVKVFSIFYYNKTRILKIQGNIIALDGVCILISGPSQSLIIIDPNVGFTSTMFAGKKMNVLYDKKSTNIYNLTLLPFDNPDVELICDFSITDNILEGTPGDRFPLVGASVDRGIVFNDNLCKRKLKPDSPLFASIQIDSATMVINGNNVESENAAAGEISISLSMSATTLSCIGNVTSGTITGPARRCQTYIPQCSLVMVDYY